MSEREHVVLAQVLVNGPGPLGAGFDDEHIAGLERHRRLALDLDGAAAREQMAVFPGVVVDLPDPERRLPNAGSRRTHQLPAEPPISIRSTTPARVSEPREI